MKKESKLPMRKDVTICFRTNGELRNALEAEAQKDRRSLSQAIEIILADHLKNKYDLADREQRRRYERKEVIIPAVVRDPGSSEITQQAAVILDISLGGLRISVPRDYAAKMTEEAGSRFETSFAMPGDAKPIRMICEAQRIVPDNGNVHIGATFVDVEFQKYQQLQHYLH